MKFLNWNIFEKVPIVLLTYTKVNSKMINIRNLQLKKSSILYVPFSSFTNDFTFIVNGEEFKTSRVISDIISPKISQMHASDATIDRFTINTKHSGNFTNFLQLINFKRQDIQKSEVLFINEVLEILGTICEYDEVELTDDNIFEYLSIHEKENSSYYLLYCKEIEYIASHFYEYCESKRSELKKLKISTLFDIVNSTHITLKDEDQLLNFINDMNSEDDKYSILYESVNFANASVQEMKHFISIYNFEKITNTTWSLLCDRLITEMRMKGDERSQNDNRYNYNKNNNNKNQEQINEKINELQKNAKDFQFTGNGKGIINYLREKTSNKIENEINVTASSQSAGAPINVLLDNDKYVITSNIQNSSITLNFINHRVILTSYTLKDGNKYIGIPKGWAIEGSNDFENWEVIDERSDVHRIDEQFKINQKNYKVFKSIRIRQTIENWKGKNNFSLSSIELYGSLI